MTGKRTAGKRIARSSNADAAGHDYLLEIKANGALPLPIIKILEQLSLYPSSFSKYGVIYSSMHTQQDLQKGDRNYVYKYH